MKELREMYEFLTKEIQDEHDQYVESNWKINSLHQALQQIKDVGDISSEPARKVLQEEYSKEVKWNEKHVIEMNAHRSFLRKFEREAKKYGLELNFEPETKVRKRIEPTLVPMPGTDGEWGKRE